ncbi:uncharacterized protein EV420DRAFT_1237176, partial [Desarmillaria tabescens]
MTAHKAQGQMLENIVVNLENCQGTEAPYVMISRVKTLDGLIILRDYKFSRLSTQQSEDYRKEDRWLNILHLLTV